MSNAAAFAALAKMQGALRALSRVPSQAASDASDKIAALIQEEFDNGTDPFGTPWEPHAESTIQRWGEHSILDLTGDMRGDVQVQPMGGAGISVTVEAEYAPFHITGTANMPARPFFPERSLPDTWQRAIADAAEAAFTRTIEEAG